MSLVTSLLLVLYKMKRINDSEDQKMKIADKIDYGWLMFVFLLFLLLRGRNNGLKTTL